MIRPSEEPRPVVVVGPGAVGTMLAARLEHGLSGRSVCLAGSKAPSPETAAHLRAIEADGVLLEGESPCAARPLVCRGPMDFRASYLLIAVKAGSMEAAAAQFARMVDEETITAVLSNGLDVCAHLPPACRAGGVVRGLVNTGAEMTNPGRLRQFGPLDLTLAPEPGGGQGAAPVERLAQTLGAAGIRVRTARDGKEAEWRKAIANAVINPLGAALGLRNGELLEVPSSAVLVEALSRELQTLIDAEGLRLDALEVVRQTARATAGNRNSMWQDLARGRPSEIREVTGRLLERAEARGVSLPTHKSLYYRILSTEAASSPPADALDTPPANP